MLTTFSACYNLDALSSCYVIFEMRSSERNMTKSKDKLALGTKQPISFPRWREVLSSEKLHHGLLHSHETEIFGYLKYLKATRTRASVETVLDYLQTLTDQGRPMMRRAQHCDGFSRPPRSKDWP
jgi:hypothetical protein